MMLSGSRFVCFESFRNYVLTMTERKTQTKAQSVKEVIGDFAELFQVLVFWKCFIGFLNELQLFIQPSEKLEFSLEITFKNEQYLMRLLLFYWLFSLSTILMLSKTSAK